jgi:hypothetical protein
LRKPLKLSLVHRAVATYLVILTAWLQNCRKSNTKASVVANKGSSRYGSCMIKPLCTPRSQKAILLCAHCRYTGTPVHRYIGTPVHRYNGRSVQWYTGTSVQRYTGTTIYRYNGIPVQRYTGTMIHRYIGTPAHVYNGTLSASLSQSLTAVTPFCISPGLMQTRNKKA